MNRVMMIFFAACAIGVYAQAAVAEDIPIVGNVESKCVIQTDTTGVYGNPTPNSLSTDTSDGGVAPIVRFDVAQADYYKALISYPESFSQSPSLTDTVTWTGSVAVDEVSDTNMSSYDTDKVQYNNTTEYDLTVAGSTWFAITSEADYGFNKAYPGGTYRAIVTAECIAQ
jgi:hypothetical protein